MTAPARTLPVAPASAGEQRPARAVLLFGATDIPGTPSPVRQAARAALLCASGHPVHSHDLPSHAQR